MAIPLTSLVRITLATLVLIATGMSVTSAETTVPSPPSKSSTESQNVGVFTGKFVDEDNGNAAAHLLVIELDVVVRG